MSLYITQHALDAAKEDLGITSKRKVRDEAIAAMIYGKRKNNAFLYSGAWWCFNPKLDTLKTVYPA